MIRKTQHRSLAFLSHIPDCGQRRANLYIWLAGQNNGDMMIPSQHNDRGMFGSAEKALKLFAVKSKRTGNFSAKELIPFGTDHKNPRAFCRYLLEDARKTIQGLLRAGR
jgi:hypothetical protein